MLYFNLRHFRNLACVFSDYQCKYPKIECLDCQFTAYCEHYADLSSEVENKPFIKAPRYYISLAKIVIRWAEDLSLTNHKGYMEGLQYLKEYGESRLC